MTGQALHEWSVLIRYRTTTGRSSSYLAGVLATEASDEAEAIKLAEARLRRHRWRRVGSVTSSTCNRIYRT